MNKQELEKAAKQRKKMVALRLKGLTHREIGERMRPQISKQAVARRLRIEGVR